MKIPHMLASALATLTFATNSYAAPFPLHEPASPQTNQIILAQGAQFELGVSDGLIFRVLTQNGYGAIKITKRRMTKARAEACKGGKKYDVEIGFDGRIRRATEIGSCRRAIDIRMAEQILHKKGFRDIRINPGGEGFLGVACRGPHRLRLSLNRFGEIQREKRLGRCGHTLDNHDIAAQLRASGFSRIRVNRGQRGGFSAIACRGDRQVELRLDNNGFIKSERRTGRCDPAIHPASIANLLARYGFSRVDVIDRQLPRYVAHACRGTERVAVSMDRYGEIVDEHRIGRCDPPLTSAQLEAKLRDVGYGKVRVIDRTNSGFIAEVCEERRLIELTLTVFGETISEKELGRCESRRVGGVLKSLEKRGMSNPRMFVVGCRKGMKVRLELDRYGSVASSTVKGRCPDNRHGINRR